MTERLHLSYDDYGRLLGELIRRLEDSHTHVYGPPRGGLPLAVHLAHHCRLSLIVDETSLAAVCGDHHAPRILLVDDIADTGGSLERLTALLDQAGIPATTATLYYKARSVVEPDIWLVQVPDHTWVVFPWERPDEAPNRPLKTEPKDTS